MKVFKLNSSHLPDTTIQDFESLAWSERYQEAGDFQMVVENDISILTLLPLGVLISHTDTTEVMIVENHEIERDAKKNLKVIVSGRSFETFSENRYTVGSETPLVDQVTGDTNVQTLAAGPASAAVSQLLKSALENGTAAVKDVVPNLLVRTDVSFLDADLEHVVKRGDVYSKVLEFLKLCDAGLKTIRPNGAQTTMDLVIHDGEDLTTSVIFYAQYEDLENAKYFWSIKNYKNYALLAAKYYARVYRDRVISVGLTGLDRRIMYLEANDLEGIYDPPDPTDVFSARAQAALDSHPKIALIQAQVSKTAKPKFKIDYDVGDLVTVFGEFVTAQPMRVTEHVLTVDKDGMRGFPSLSAL